MRRGTVVLTPFPFTDLSGSKIRPAVVVSQTDRPGVDVVLAFISSVLPPILLATDLLLEVSHADFPTTGLKVSSAIRCDKLATVDRRVVLGQLGTLSVALQQAVNQRLRQALDL